MSGFHAPRRSVYISCAGADLWVAQRLATDITGHGATALLDETLAFSTRDEDKLDLESQVLKALNAADEILVLLTHTPGLVERRFLWLAIGWASARGIPIIGLLHGMTPEELSAKSEFPSIIKNNKSFEYHNDRDSYLNQLKHRLAHPLEEPAEEPVGPLSYAVRYVHSLFEIFMPARLPRPTATSITPGVGGEGFYGFDLRLMSSLNDVSGIPTEGKSLIIVAGVNDVLHFRIFGGDGKVVVDTDGRNLTEQARKIEDLREQLKSLWPSHKLTWSDKVQVVTAVTSIFGRTPSYDVFLCYNSEDKEEVKELAAKLKAQGLNPWLDEWDVPPGWPWQPVLGAQIPWIRTAAVFIGRNGLGPWQNIEIFALLQQFVMRLCPVIPVILRDYGRGDPQFPLPLFSEFLWLQLMGWVDFRKPDPDPFRQLVWGITGYKGP